MFLFLAIISTFGYALQSSLMAKFSRKGDSMSIGVYRSLSLGISLLPLLFFTTFDNILNIFDYQFELIISSICINLTVWAYFEAFKFLPVGIAVGFRSLATVFAVVAVSWFLFGENLNSFLLFFITVSVFGGVILSFFKSEFGHLDNENFFKGILLSVFSGVAAAISIVIMVKVSRELDPFATAYFWEVEAGLTGLILLFFRKKLFAGKIEKISKKDFRNILLASSPTLIGTGGFAIASLMGPAGIISAVGVLGIVFSVIFGVIFFKEHLKLVQYIGIGIIVFGILGIKLYGT